MVQDVELEAKPPLTFWGLVRRIVVGSILAIGMWFLKEEHLDRLTNIVTILAVAIPIWALFDRKFAAWLAARFSEALAAAKHLRRMKPWQDFRSWRARRNAVASAKRQERREKRSPHESPAPSIAAVIPIQRRGVPSNPAGSQADHGTGPPWTILWNIVPVRAVAAVVILAAIGATIFVLANPGATPRQPIVVAVAETVPGPVEAATTPVPRWHVVRKTDRCWSMAQRCTGDGRRFVELGPLNGIDVSDVDRCLIIEGRSIRIPADWPEGCLDR